MLNAIAKLEAIGAELGYPHTSQVQGSTVRELRPRGGRSPGARSTDASGTCWSSAPSGQRRRATNVGSEPPSSALCVGWTR